MKKATAIIGTLIGVLIVASLAVFVKFVYPRYIEPGNTYSKAAALYNSGDYQRAAMTFSTIPGYRNSSAMALDSWLRAGNAKMQSGDLDGAYACYQRANADESVFESIDEAYFERGKALYASDPDLAEANFDCINSDTYSVEIDSVRIFYAAECIKKGEYEAAAQFFSLCGKERSDEISELWYAEGRNLLERYELANAYRCYNNARKCTSDAMLSDMLTRISNDWSEAMLKALANEDTELIEEFFSYSSMFSAENVMAERDRLRYEQACTCYDAGDYRSALSLLLTVSEGYERSADMIADIRARIARSAAAGGSELGAYLDMNGSITLLGSGWSISAPNWANIESIAVGKSAFILGVRSNGTVVAKGASSYDRHKVDDWKNIVAVACGRYHSIGLTGSGKVLSCGWNYYGQRMTEAWHDIIAVACGSQTSYALNNEGRVFAVGDDSMGQLNVGSWRNITAISAGENHIVGLQNDGKCLAAGSNSSKQCNVSAWSDIVAISAGNNHTVGLRSDGTVVAVGDNTFGQCNVSGFTDVAAIAAGGDFTIIVFSNGDYTVIGDNADAGSYTFNAE